MAETNVSKNLAVKTALSLKVTLRGTKPPIWRRLLMPDTATLGDLHEAIQAAMGWRGGHLHAFDIGGRQYGDPHSVDDVAHENRLTLKGVAKSRAARFLYTYDFGDNWEHLVLIEKPVPVPQDGVLPRCVAGKRNCPPEDCGGAWGYAELLAVLADPSHPDHAEQCEWVDDDFDPEEFDLESANRILAARFGRR